MASGKKGKELVFVSRLLLPRGLFRGGGGGTNEAAKTPESAADVFFCSTLRTYVGISSGQFVRFASLARRGLIWPGMPISPLSFLPVFLFSALSAWKV